MADICLLVNAASGSGGGERLARLREAASRHGGRIETRALDGDPAEAARHAAGEGFATVVACGGDGTINAVAKGLLDTGARLGVVPMGTFNYFARGHGLPLDPEEALAVVAEGREGAIGVGEANGEIFLNNASLGLYPQILRQREEVYGRFGRSRLAAHWSVLKTLLSAGAAMRLRVSVDGETHRFRSPLLFVAMNPFQLDLFSLEGRECLEDDRFAVYAVPDASRPRLMGLAARLAVGGLRPREHFTLYCGSEVVVESDRARHTLAFDGERARHASPFRFRLRARALKAMLPREDARAEAGAAVREDARGGA